MIYQPVPGIESLRETGIAWVTDPFAQTEDQVTDAGDNTTTEYCIRLAGMALRRS